GRLLPLRRANGRRQNRGREAAGGRARGRVPALRHERVHGEAHRVAADRRAARLRGLRPGRGADRRDPQDPARPPPARRDREGAPRPVQHPPPGDGPRDAHRSHRPQGRLPPRDRPADARRAAVARRARLRQDLRRAADGALDPDRDQARAGRRDALRAAPRRRAGRDRRGPGRARVPLRAAQGAGGACRAGLSVAHIGPLMSVVSMALCAVCAALLGTAGTRARLSAERLATASALGLALFLWLPYLSARAWGIERGAWISFGVLALLAGAGVVRVIRHGAPAAVEERGSDARPGWLTPTRWWPGLCLLLLTVGLGYLLFNLSFRVRDGGLWTAGNGCEDMGLHATLANAF